MRKLDKHLLRELIVPLAFSAYIIIFLFLVGDLFDNLSEIINNNTPIKDIIKYYAYLIPFAYVQTIPWATFFSIVYVFLNLKRNHEIIAMKACGLKITQIAAPIFFLGIAIGVVTFTINDKVVPYTYSQAEIIRKEKIEHKSSGTKEKTLKHTTLVSGNRQYFIKKIDPTTDTLKDIRIHILEDKEKYVEKRISAQTANWVNDHWVLKDVAIHNLDRNGRIIGEPINLDEKTFEIIKESPKDFYDANFDSEFLSTTELKKHIKRLESNGLNVNPEKAALHSKLALPWQSLVIMIITIPLLSQTANIRRNAAKNVLLCLIAVVSYHVVSAISLAIGTSGFLIPSISAWFANIGFTMFGLFSMDKANY